MSLLPYKGPNWSNHRASAILEIDFPLFAQGVENHFTLLRAFSGPFETSKLPRHGDVDSVFDGELHGDFTGTDADDILSFASAHNLLTGVWVVVEVDSGLSNITDAATYYVIRVDETRIKLATSLVNARAGTAVSLGSDGVADLRYPKAYVVGHSKLAPGDGGQVGYSILFATVPPQWSELGEVMNFPFPAVAAGSVGNIRDVTAISVSGGNAVLTVSADPGLVSGDSCYVSVSFTRGGQKYFFNGYTRATASSTGSDATILDIFGAMGSGAFSSVSGKIAKAFVGRALPKTLAVKSRIVHDYAFSSVASVDTDLPLAQMFTPVIMATATETDSLTGATQPTSTAYATLAAAGGEIVAEPATHAPYLGLIYERRTRLIPAS